MKNIIEEYGIALIMLMVGGTVLYWFHQLLECL